MSEQEVLELVRRWAEAELIGDADAYGEVLAQDFIGVGPAGFVLTRDQWAERHREGLENEEFEVQDPHVRIYGDTAIVEAVQKQRTSFKGSDTSGSFRLIAVAVKQEGRWVLANIQLSGPLVPPGPKPSFAR